MPFSVDFFDKMCYIILSFEGVDSVNDVASQHTDY